MPDICTVVDTDYVTVVGVIAIFAVIWLIWHFKGTKH